VLKFSVQTFYPPLFSHPFPFSNFPLAILFPSLILFPSKSFPHQNAQSKKPKPKAKAQSKSQKQKAQKNLKPSFSRPLIPSGKQGGALREGHDIVTEKTCIPASLNINNLGETAVLLFPVYGWGCA
jgi:hypothetical protein